MNNLVKVTKDDIKKCLNFSFEIINTENQYNRFNKTTNTQIERTFVGKLGEYIFLKYLNLNNIKYLEGDMFKIFEGKENVDEFDFITKENRKVEIKVASKPFHKRIMVPIDQFQMKKDFYVGIKLNSKLDKNDNILKESITEAEIYGFIERNVLDKTTTKNFGEGYCKSIELNRLKNIKELILKF
jgi:hypothetical protein